MSDRIQHAIKKGDKARVFSLLSKLDAIDALGKNGFNVLHFATCYGRIEIAQSLLEEYGANVHTPTLKGNTALHIACFEGFCDMVCPCTSRHESRSWKSQRPP